MAWVDNTIMLWDDGLGPQKITDHNRGPLSVSVERIEKSQRMANGRMRKYHVADKRTWSTSWSMLPSRNTVGSVETADGGLTGEDMEAFYTANTDTIMLTIREGDGTVIGPVEVFFGEFSKEIVKRGAGVDFWELSVSLVEV